MLLYRPARRKASLPASTRKNKTVIAIPVIVSFHPRLQSRLLPHRSRVRPNLPKMSVPKSFSVLPSCVLKGWNSKPRRRAFSAWYPISMTFGCRLSSTMVRIARRLSTQSSRASPTKPTLSHVLPGSGRSNLSICRTSQHSGKSSLKNSRRKKKEPKKLKLCVSRLAKRRAPNCFCFRV